MEERKGVVVLCGGMFVVIHPGNDFTAYGGGMFVLLLL